ncbi:hypothetical protein [Sphaerotilus sp.]|nr:hypothetical protein [Sphaerotilus sp.]
MSCPRWIPYVLVVAMSLLVSLYQPVDVPQHAPHGSVAPLEFISLGLIR